jgi:hypothetical protein
VHRNLLKTFIIDAPSAARDWEDFDRRAKPVD